MCLRVCVLLLLFFSFSASFIPSFGISQHVAYKETSPLIKIDRFFPVCSLNHSGRLTSCCVYPFFHYSFCCYLLSLHSKEIWIKRNRRKERKKMNICQRHCYTVNDLSCCRFFVCQLIFDRGLWLQLWLFTNFHITYPLSVLRAHTAGCIQCKYNNINN